MRTYSLDLEGTIAMTRRLLTALLMAALVLCGGAPHMLLAQTPPSAVTGPATASQMVEQGTRHILDTLNTRRA